MKLVILLSAVLSLALARPQNPASILRYDFNNDGTGGYNLDVSLSDGTKRQEQGKLINEGREDEAIVVKGFYEYVGTDGKIYNVQYTADENGFKPKGEHLPSTAGGALNEIPLRNKQINSAVIQSLIGK